MADIYELVLSVDIRADVTDDELAELRWHVGQGARPERLPIGTDRYVETYPLGDPDDPDCEWEDAEPAPVFAQRGAARRVGGALVAELAARESAAIAPLALLNGRIRVPEDIESHAPHWEDPEL
ncbi:hypothetical protein [Nonomuraea sp. 10N515B]|uniref:hypothetical protein n=1 Tax=Nonomuraea sp. 10N515B TaxID=3457422 RepID=UPI003FCE28C9